MNVFAFGLNNGNCKGQSRKPEARESLMSFTSEKAAARCSEQQHEAEKHCTKKEESKVAGKNKIIKSSTLHEITSC